jgi:hypothetical protein
MAAVSAVAGDVTADGAEGAWAAAAGAVWAGLASTAGNSTVRWLWAT